VHQNVRIGAQAFVGGLAGVEGDVIPFALAGGNRAHLFGLNIVGLRRRGFTDERIARLKTAYRALFASGEMVFAERLTALAATSDGDADAMAIVAFLRGATKRPICTPRRWEQAR
jgi:UDP-N-acetylglucosamine acyltransferase